MIKYDRTVTFIGDLIDEFVSAGVLVFFGEGAPEELADVAVIHTGTELIGEIAPGDTVVLGNDALKVLAVGPIANTNLRNLGHLVLKASGETEAELPGDVCVEALPLPSVGVGMRFAILGGGK